ncbi:hypothetical protein [Nitrosomonas ureae]|uniref:hypothetical protein n=1 Tax=Nitrosomonas ureae TaxID=44577 RepID=UPI001160DB83|nr:hypothetical protein [Nitrosomonas ureae]
MNGVPGVPPPALIWSYDTGGTNGIGRLTGMSDESGSTSFSFGRTIQMTYPYGTQVTTAYGADGRPNEIRVNGNLLLAISSINRLASPRAGCGVITRRMRAASIPTVDSKPIALASDTRTLTYNAANCVINTADTNPVYNRTYDYDALNRLTSQSDNTSFLLWDRCQQQPYQHAIRQCQSSLYPGD